MSILAIDLWNKKCWLAVSCENIAFPLKIVQRVSLISNIKILLRERNISTIVVWLPFDLYNKDLKQLNKTEKFIEKLKETFKDKEIIWIDERFTTFEAKIFSKKKHIDDISASLILDTYLSKKKNNLI